jgi:hypothetical protein
VLVQYRAKAGKGCLFQAGISKIRRASLTAAVLTYGAAPTLRGRLTPLCVSLT